MTTKINPVDKGALTSELESAGNRRRQLGHDAGQNNQRNSVADAARGDLLAQPHQEHRAAGERDRGRDQEEDTGTGNNAACTLQTDADAVSLERRQQHGEVPRVLIHDLAALLAFFLQRLERGRNRRHQLNDDRGRDVRHDIERKDRHPVDAATGEHVEHPKDAAGLRVEDLRPGVGIDAGQRDIRAQPIDQQRTDREPDSLLEFFGFGECREVEIGRQLFRCRNHRLLPRPPTLPAAISLASSASGFCDPLDMPGPGKR